MISTSYLPRHYCWNGTSIQVAVDEREKILDFLHKHLYLRAYSGLRAHEPDGDHRCGAAVDFVPLSIDKRGHNATLKAHADAEARVKKGEFAYVEPMADTWRPGNHHLHVSFRRCR